MRLCAREEGKGKRRLLCQQGGELVCASSVGKCGCSLLTLRLHEPRIRAQPGELRHVHVRHAVLHAVLPTLPQRELAVVAEHALEGRAVFHT